ncbi:four helix bundle protein [Algoriphagus formosus]|uniref:Four helix bundle protein n=1 Tax=Algoriphagus formosus TaxID=2007308 RepID=A0A4R5UW74_9BACT|nr:four helix bundle protein [Algoriphagus aquimaris]TDK43520.1 four helix bundle protein [Algoriphagus aquimaris]
MEEYKAHFKFENLLIWQKAMDFGEMIFEESKSFPKDETFNLISQARRAGDSIALNISEGSISQSNPEFRKFVNYAVRSLAEVVTCLHKAKRRNYINAETFKQLYQEAFHLMNMLQSFKSKIK